VRETAQLRRQTVSGYAMSVVLRAVDYEEWLFGQVEEFRNSWARNAHHLTPGPRTAIHLRCTAHEANRIRKAAERRGASISAFVLRCLWRSWEAAEASSKASGNVAHREQQRTTRAFGSLRQFAAVSPRTSPANHG
jgi:hypothetical protein